MPETFRSHAHALYPLVSGLVALTHVILALHTGLLAILRRLLLAVLGALVLAIFRAGLAGGTAVILIHDYHLTVSSMPPRNFLYAGRKKFFYNWYTPAHFYVIISTILSSHKERMIRP